MKIIFAKNFSLIGGYDGEDSLNSVERFDPRDANKCVQMKAMKESRLGAAAAEYKGLIYMTGGIGSNDVEMFAFFRFIYFTFKLTVLTLYLFRFFAYNFFEICNFSVF